MGPAYRTFAGMMICLFFAVALMILAGLAYIFNSWFQLALVTSVPFVVLFRYKLYSNEFNEFLQYFFNCGCSIRKSGSSHGMILRIKHKTFLCS